MRISGLKSILTLAFVLIYISAFSQDNFRKSNTAQGIIDSLKKSGAVLGHLQKPDILFSTDQALKYLEKRIFVKLWHDAHDPLRQAFGQLIYESQHPPFDSLRNILTNYPYDSLNIPWDKFYIWEPVKVKIPVQQSLARADSSITADAMKRDSLVQTIPRTLTRPVAVYKDTTIMVITDTLHEVVPSRADFPFTYETYPFQSDSIKAAVKALLSFIDKRDSTIFNFTGIGKTITPIMINSRSERMIRYWLKNEFSDSVAVWIGNPSRNTIGLYLEQGVNFRRPGRQGNYANPKIDVQHVDTKKLQDFQNVAIKPGYWKYKTEASFVLNQTAMSNWVKGGEGSVATALDITGYADYNNKERKISSANFARLKFGYLASGKEGVKKNLDLLETNSKLNHLAFGKVDFSAILLFKTQIARGFNYFTTAAGKDTSSLVSKFMNPGTITIGFGFDYKPNPKTSINFSPLSYKGTFVTDPAYMGGTYDSTKIDQTQYGISKNRRSLNEPGASFMISNEFNPMSTLTIVNRLQLFTNYIHNPRNIDVDWEMIATAHLNWFTDVRLNTHLIFDDDTKTSEQNKHGMPILAPDGTEKKTARVQFKEMIGFSLSFRF